MDHRRLSRRLDKSFLADRASSSNHWHATDVLCGPIAGLANHPSADACGAFTCC